MRNSLFDVRGYAGFDGSIGRFDSSLIVIIKNQLKDS